MEEGIQNEDFVQLLTQAQGPLYGYILTLLPSREAAADVLQETNLVLWRKMAEFTSGTNFTAWSCRIAYFQVCAYLTGRGRDRHLFDDALLATVASQLESRVAEISARQQALRKCLSKLAPPEQELIMARYAEDSSVNAMAERLHKSANAVSRALYRIRNLLEECIKRTLRETEGA